MLLATVSGATRATLVGGSAILLWAGLAVLTVLTSGLPPFEVLSLSFGIAFFSGLGFLAVRGPGALAQLGQPLAPWLTAFIGIFGYHALYFYALKAAPAAEANLITYLWPLLIVVFASLLPGERLRLRHSVGALLGLAGTALIVLGRDASDAVAVSWAGYAAAFACAFLWSGYSVLNRRFAQTPSSMLIGVCGAVALAGGLCHALFETPVIPNGTQALALVVLGIGPTGLAFLAWDHATKRGHLAVLGALSYLAPLLSTSLLVAIGSAPVTPQLAVSAMLVVGGAILATGGRTTE
jgi:drug/metabolite transporter (DMT)-like permease